MTTRQGYTKKPKNSPGRNAVRFGSRGRLPREPSDPSTSPANVAVALFQSDSLTRGGPDDIAAPAPMVRSNCLARCLTLFFKNLSLYSCICVEEQDDGSGLPSPVSCSLRGNTSSSLRLPLLLLFLLPGCGSGLPSPVSCSLRCNTSSSLRWPLLLRLLRLRDTGRDTLGTRSGTRAGTRPGRSIRRSWRKLHGGLCV